MVLCQPTNLAFRKQNDTLSSPSYSLTPRCWITKVSFISKSPFAHEKRSIIQKTNIAIPYSTPLLRSIYVYFLYAVQNWPDTACRETIKYNIKHDVI